MASLRQLLKQRKFTLCVAVYWPRDRLASPGAGFRCFIIWSTKRTDVEARAKKFARDTWTLPPRTIKYYPKRMSKITMKTFDQGLHDG